MFHKAAAKQTIVMKILSPSVWRKENSEKDWGLKKRKPREDKIDDKGIRGWLVEYSAALPSRNWRTSGHFQETIVEWEITGRKTTAVFKRDCWCHLITVQHSKHLFPSAKLPSFNFLIKKQKYYCHYAWYLNWKWMCIKLIFWRITLLLCSGFSNFSMQLLNSFRKQKHFNFKQPHWFIK